MTIPSQFHFRDISLPRRIRNTTSLVRRLSILRLDRLEKRILMTAYYPAVADYSGTGVVDISEFRYDNSGTQQLYGRNALLIQLAQAGTFTGYEMGYTATDKPTPADFDGDGKADPAVYGFLDNISYGNYYGTTPTPGTAQPFPNGSGRFAYIPSSGNYPVHDPGAVNGTMNLTDAKVVIVNIGGPGDIPAPADYFGHGKADFAVYEPSKAQFLFYDSATFDPNANPTQPGNAPKAVPLGKVGDVPASADYEGIGHAQFAAYDAASGTFFVRPSNGSPTKTFHLGGPGDIPVSADYEGTGRADYAVYDPSKGVFLFAPSDGSATRVVAIGAPGDTPVPGKFGDGRVDFATYTSSTQQFQFIQFPTGIKTRSLMDPDAIPIEKTDDLSVATHAEYAAQTQNPAVMFFGDSLLSHWLDVGTDSWQGRISQFNPSNNSETFDTTQNLLWRIVNGELDKVHPRVVVLGIGDNDFVDRSPAQVAHTIRVIMDQIHARSPGTSILLLGILPRGQYLPVEIPNTFRYDAYVESEVRDFDQNYLPLLAEAFGSRNTNTYPSGDYSLDLRSTFSANPSDPNNYFGDPNKLYDLLHPNKLGYELWASAIATPLRLMLHRQPVSGDYDGDGKTDFAVYEPSVGGFAVQLSSSGTNIYVPFGAAGAGQSLMAPGDYDGDGKTDFAVYEPSAGGFAVKLSSSNTDVFVPFGIKGAGQSIPAPGDYDGDGRTDLAVYEPSVGAFVIHSSATGTDQTIPFGIAGAGQSIPAPGDYDGDGRTDLAVYEPSKGQFVYRPSSGGPDVTVPFGLPGTGQSIPVPGDYDGNGKTDLAVYLPSLGAFVYRNSATGQDVTKYYGIAGAGQSIPAPGDYDGDGKTDFAVYGPSVRGFAVNLSGSDTNLFLPYGIGGAGQSIPPTSTYDASLGTPNPAGSEVAPSSTPTPTPAPSQYQPTQVAQAVPTAPAFGWKSWLATGGKDPLASSPA